MNSLRPEPGPEAARLRVPPPAPYVYRSRVKRTLAAALDALGSLLFAPAPRSVAWASVRSAAVLRLDHLGDLLHLLPALRRLRRALPQARLDLWVGPWGAELAGLFADVDAVRVAQADWFRRPARVEWPWAQIFALAAALRREAYDVAFEPRGDLRHHLALALAGIPVRAGHCLTAGRFFLTHPARWSAALHEQEQALALLDQAGVPLAYADQRPYLRLPPAAEREAAALARELRLGRGPILIQAACGTQAKRWDPAAWVRVIRGLPRSRGVALLGSAAEREEMRSLAARAGRRVGLASGRLSLPGLAAFLKRAALLLSVDSGPAHLAAVQDVPVLALFSATNRASQWAPRGPRVKVLQAQGFPCAPCELAVCPYGNACMAALDADTVLAEARAMLGRR